MQQISPRGDKDLVTWLIEELTKTVPWVKPIDEAERAIFDGDVGAQFFQDNWYIPFTAIAIYLPMVFLGPSILNYFDWHFKNKAVTGTWSLGLSLFSMWGSSIMIPAFLFDKHMGLLSQGFHASVCDEAHYGFGNVGYATWLFIFSKIPEFGDTVLMVLSGRPVIFLHWYHHITVCLFCWHTFATKSSIGLWFMTMNYFVHSVMYFYYFLTQFGTAMRKRLAIVKTPITILQTSQMFIGTFICIYSLVHRDYCPSQNQTNSILGLMMYSTYFYLFFQFLLKQCMGQNKKQKRS